ncbi:MAG: DUF4340 domain-containing protein [Gammaproteobacteria bacterium]|nr:DUF4340 domain-containing protein [Gammaproteobacteria bacterium]
MKLKQLIIVLSIALIALILGSSLLADKHGEQSFEHKALLSDVDWQALNGIELEQGGKTLVIEKVLQEWQIASKDGYPADKEKLSKFLQSLKDAKVIELKTKLEKNYHRLGLSLDDSDNQSSGVLLSLSGAGDKSAVELVLGNNAKDNRGQYARLLSEPQSYLIDQTLDINLDGSDWIEPQLFELVYNDVSQIDVNFASGESFVIHRPIEETNEDESTNDNVDQNTEQNNEQTSENRSSEFVLKFASNAAEFEQLALKYDTIFSGLVRNVLNVKATDAQLLSDTNEELLKENKAATFELSYQVSGAEKTQSFTLYKQELEDDSIKYYITFSGGKYLLSISEFNYNQLVKPLSDYYQAEETQEE